MKNKIKLFLTIYIIIQFCFSIKSLAAETNETTSYDDVINAIQKIEYSYYMRGPNIQYNSMKGNPSYFSPEEATTQNVNYLVCSAFTKNIYYELLGIKIPPTTANLLKYSRDHIGNPEVIAHGSKNDNTFSLRIYDSSAENNYNTITNPNLQNILPYLQIGDILTSGGHSIIVYDLVYDDFGNVVDAIIMQCEHSAKPFIITKIPFTTKIGNDISFGNGNHCLIFNKILNTTYGQIEGGLNINQLSQERAWNNISSSSDEYSILRFIQKDGNENAILNYLGEGYDDTNHSNQLIQLSDKIKSRMNYDKIYIEKTIDAHSDDIVVANDELTYTIVVKNKSLQNYNDDIIVTENLSDNVIYKDYTINKENVSFTPDLDNKKIEWNIGKLNSGEEVIINYKVVVKDNCFGNTIESTGTVANIPSTVVKNKIGYNIPQTQVNEISTSYNNLKNNYNGKKLINEIYKDALGVDLNFEEFNITDLVKNTNSPSTSSTTLYLNTDNSFYNSVLNKYWSTLSRKGYTYNTRNDVIANDLKTWRDYTDEDRRADTIYGENFKTGDILIYTNSNDVIYSYSNSQLTTTPVTFEDGEYAYIYIEGQGFVGKNIGNDGIPDTDDDRNAFTAEYYTDIEKSLIYRSEPREETEEDLAFANYQTLFGKDYYVILRPSLSFDIIPLELNVSYSTTQLTNQNVTATIVANEEIRSIEGWDLSEDKKTLTKTYSENATENVTITDLSGHTADHVIEISNIDKEDPVVTVSYSTNELTSNDVVATIEANEQLQEIEGWEISNDKKSLSHTYTSNSEDSITVCDLAGNSISVAITIENIDKANPECQIGYSTTQRTNNDVTVTITANEQIQPIEGWNISEDNKVLTKTYTENTTETIIITDLAGNTSTYNIEINNIDKISPVATVSYSTTELTSNDVIVTIEADKELREIEGWQLSDDNKSLSKTYSSNAEESVTIYDLAGNNITKTITVNNIDKEKPEYEISYSTTLYTNNDVTVTITANKQIQPIEGWNISEDNKVLTKTYTENTTEAITITDLAGHTETSTIVITNIDKEDPVVTVSYSTTELTSNDVIVTIEANKELREIEGWQLSDDHKSLRKTYSLDAEESVTIYDFAGNNITKTITVNNIDKEKPEYEINYSTTISTNKDVTVTITANEQIQPIEGWNISEDNKVLTKTYSENTVEEIIIKDILENCSNTIIIKINNIDKISPEFEISYNITTTTDENVIATITANEELQEVNGWTLSRDRKVLTKEFSANTEENITITDLSGNTQTKTIKITNINKEKKYNNSNSENVISKHSLPNAGKNNIIIFVIIIILIMLSLFAGIKIIKNRDVK